MRAGLARLERDLLTAGVPVTIALKGDPTAPAWLLERVGALLAADLAIRPVGPQYGYVYSVAQPDVYPFSYDGSTDPEEALVLIADSAQQLVVLDHEPPGRTWPPCPRHIRHPLWAVLQDGRAMWRCPQDATVRVPVGGLGGPSGPDT